MNIKVFEKNYLRRQSYFVLKNSNLINLEFIHVNFKSSCFEKYLIKNTIFEEWSLIIVFLIINCLFINCNLSEVDGIEIIFNECTFLKSDFNKAIFELCHLLQQMFEDMNSGPLDSTVLIDSQFSNSKKSISKKSIEFEIEVYFNNRFDQIEKF